MANYIAEDSLSEKTGYSDLVRRIWPFVKKYRVGLCLLMILVVVQSGVSRLLPMIMGQVVDQVVLAKKLHLLGTLCASYLALEILRFTLVCTETYFFQIYGLKIVYDMRSKLFMHVQRLPITYFDKNPIGRIVTRITNDFSALSELFTAGIVTVIVDLVSLLAIVTAMFWINVKLTLLVLSISPIMLWSTFYLSGRARDCLSRIKKASANMNAFISENIMGMKITQLYSQELKQTGQFKKINDQYKGQQMENMRYLAWLHPVLNGFNAFTVAMALYGGGLLSQDGEGALPVGLLVAFLVHVQDFLPPLRNILEKYQTFQSSLASAERIFTVFDQPEEPLNGKDFDQTRPLRGEIEFRNVCFRYSSDGDLILKNISFKIDPGEKTALVGTTGSGKSTIIHLIQKFYSPESGQILIDGEDISQISATSLRQRFGLVQQDFFTFRGSVESNISLDDSKIKREAVLEAADKTQCKHLLKRGEIQEKGANLSVGERQLLGFARALAFNPDILILDEATAHIDIQSEELIQKALLQATSFGKKRTTLIVAHRLSTVQDCDKIFVLDRGKLVETGNHESLMAAGGHYKALQASQIFES